MTELEQITAEEDKIARSHRTPKGAPTPNEVTIDAWEHSKYTPEEWAKFNSRKGKAKPAIKKRADVKQALLDKLQRYINSMGISRNEKNHVERECRRLQEKLEIKSISPREYVFLNKIRESMTLGRKADLKTMALQSGYGLREANEPEITILRDIPPALMSEILGFNRGDIESELVKVMKQDNDLSAKIRAIEVAARIIGTLSDEKGVKIQINNTGFKLDK